MPHASRLTPYAARHTHESYLPNVASFSRGDLTTRRAEGGGTPLLGRPFKITTPDPIARSTS
jgi:hypothetical protein